MTEQRPAAELRTTQDERERLSKWDDWLRDRRYAMDMVARTTLADLIATLSAANLRLEQRVEELEMELRTIATRRFDRTVFDDDTSFADWAQSRARAALAKVRP